MFSSKKTAIFLVAAVIISSCRFYFDTTKDTITSDPAKASIANGKNLAFNVCAGCHYSETVGKFTGRPLNDLPKIAGKLYSANLTQSTTHGIPPKYSDAELFYLLKTGIAKDGRFMPYMMRPMMADEDVKDLVAYLRSNDAAVSAADTTVGTSHINFIGKMGIRFATKPTPYKTGVPQPDKNNPIDYGRYLVAIIGCYHCHSSSALKLDFLEPEKSKGYMQGGMKLKDPQGKKIYGPNLTQDAETGIGNYTLADFTSAVRTGVAPGGRQLGPPMPKFRSLTDQQVNAIYRYIRGLTPLHHEVR
jgi:mono/diheme cytochrome c family protein